VRPLCCKMLCNSLQVCSCYYKMCTQIFCHSLHKRVREMLLRQLLTLERSQVLAPSRASASSNLSTVTARSCGSCVRLVHSCCMSVCCIVLLCCVSRALLLFRSTASVADAGDDVSEDDFCGVLLTEREAALDHRRSMVSICVVVVVVQICCISCGGWQ